MCRTALSLPSQHSTFCQSSICRMPHASMSTASHISTKIWCVSAWSQTYQGSLCCEMEWWQRTCHDSREWLLRLTEVEEVGWVKWFAIAVSPQAGCEDCLSLFCKDFGFVMHLNRVVPLHLFFYKLMLESLAAVTWVSISLNQVKSIESIVLFGINNYKKQKEAAVVPVSNLLHHIMICYNITILVSSIQTEV